MKTYELVLEDCERHGTFVISIVDEPAHGDEYVAFSKDKTRSNDDEQRIITGAVLIPDTPVYRRSPEPHMVKMSKETIKKSVEQFSKLSDNTATSVDHNGKKIDGVTIIEQWLVFDKDNDKSNALGLDLPNGSWVVSMKVDNDETWEKIKNTDMLNGFSIEGLYKREIEEVNTIMEKEEGILKSFLDQLTTYFKTGKVEEEKEVDVEKVEAADEVKDEPKEVKAEVKEEVVKAEEVKEEVKEVKGFTQEEVDEMIAKALKAAKDEAVEMAKQKEEEEALALAKEEDEVETIMSKNSSTQLDKMKVTLDYFNKLKKQ